MPADKTVALGDTGDLIVTTRKGREAYASNQNADHTRLRVKTRPYGTTPPPVPPVHTPKLVYTDPDGSNPRPIEGVTLIETLYLAVVDTAIAGAAFTVDSNPSTPVIDTTKLANGGHVFKAYLTYTDGAEPTSVAVTCQVGNVIPVPPDPPIPPGPFPGFAQAEAQVSPGGRVDVPPGLYKLPSPFTAAKQGVTWNLAKGAKIDEAGLHVGVQASGIYLRGDDIKWVGEGEIFGSTGGAYTVDGQRVTFTGHVHDCVEEGYIWHGVDGRMTGGSLYNLNMTGQMWDSSEQGAGKANTKRLIIDGVHVYNIGLGGADASAGQGLWIDSINQISSAEIKNCIIHDIFYAGIFFEISDGGKLHHNVIYRAGSTPSGSGFWGAGLLCATSRNAEIHDNLIVNSKYNGIRVLCQSRGDRPGVSTNVKVFDNTLLKNGTHISVGSDNAADQAAMFAPGSGNEVSGRNRYDSPKVQWNGKTYTDLSQINALPGGGGSSILSASEIAAIMADPRLGHALTA
jgi:hypothetical protein